MIYSNEPSHQTSNDPQFYSWIDTLPGLIPKTDDGYVQSFDLSDPIGAQLFFDTYGFVVIHNVLSDTDISATLDEFWSKPNLVKDNPDTWEKFFKYQQFGRMGIVGNYSDIDSVSQLGNRQNERVYDAFRIVLQNDKLWVDHDRLGVMRPTKGIIYPGQEEPQEKPGWRTLENWLHLDCNPLAGYASIGSFQDNKKDIDFTKTLIIQGLLTLTDAKEENGGFHCVPGAHKHIRTWARNPEIYKSSSNIQVPKEDPLHEKIQKIPIRKGCLLAWTSLLPHGNHPNLSSDWRAVQYIRMMPTRGTPYFPLFPDLLNYPKNLCVSELGKKLFGLRSWDKDEIVTGQESETGQESGTGLESEKKFTFSNMFKWLK